MTQDDVLHSKIENMLDMVRTLNGKVDSLSTYVQEARMAQAVQSARLEQLAENDKQIDVKFREIDVRLKQIEFNNQRNIGIGVVIMFLLSVGGEQVLKLIFGAP